MRGTIFALSLASLATVGSASVAYDFTGWYDDTAIVVRQGYNPSTHGIVVQGPYTAIYAEGVNGGIGILGDDAAGVRATGQSQFPAVSAQGYGYYNAYGVYSQAEATYYPLAVYGEAGTGIGPIGLKGYATTISNDAPTMIGVHGVAQAWNPSYGGYQSTTIGVRAEAYGNGYYDYSYGIWASASGASGANYAGYFDGDVTVTGYCNCYPSDQKLKKNVKPLDLGLATVMALQPKAYDMKVEEYKGKLNLAKGPQFGLIAQDVEKIIPELIAPVTIPARETKDKDGKVTSKIEAIDYKSVNYVALIPVLVKAIQEQEAKIEALEKKLAAK